MIDKIDIDKFPVASFPILGETWFSEILTLMYWKVLSNIGGVATFLAIGGSRTVATSKMKRFVIIVNGWKPLTAITKHSILDVAAALDPPRLT